MREMTLSGRDIGSLRLAGTIGGLGPELFASHIPAASLLMLTATAKALDLTIQNTGLFERFLAAQAKALSLKPEELRGSTFTVTSAGKFSGSFVTPLINHPEVGILGIHRIAERPVVRDGQIVARPIGHVSVTFDHRVLDGKRAAEFGLDVISRLEREGPG